MDNCTAVFRDIAPVRVQVMFTLDATLRSVLFNRLLSSLPDTANYLASVSRTYQRVCTETKQPSLINRRCLAL